MANNHGPSSMLGRLRKVRLGLTTKLPAGTENLLIEGTGQPLDTVVGKIDGYIGVFQDAEDAHEVLTKKVTARTAAEPDVTDYLSVVQVGVSAILGPKNPTLKQFGFPPKKGAKKLSGKAIVTKADKANRTRGANHTMGKRQKKALKEKLAEPASPENPSAGLGTGGVSQGTEPKNGGTETPAPGGAGK